MIAFTRLCLAQVNYTQNVFAFVGDYGTDDSDEDSVSLLIKSWNPEAIVTLGDNNYPDGNAADIDKNIGKYFHDYIKPYVGSYGPGADTNRFWPALGNHDLLTASGAPYFNYFQLPNNERYYDFINGDIHFFCLNTDPSEPDGNIDPSVQSNWIKSKMQASQAKWKIVYGHHSPYCSDSLYGDHGFMKWPFRDWGADIVLTSHAHVYERLLVDSLPYIVCGLGGEARYLFSQIPRAGSQVRYNLKYGAVQMKEKNDSLCFRFFNVDHELIDSLFLVKPTIGIYEQSSFPFIAPEIYPNPSNGNCHLDFTNSKIQNEKVYITIMDRIGTELYKEELYVDQSSKKQDLYFHLPNGLYLMQLKVAERYYRTKFIIQNAQR